MMIQDLAVQLKLPYIKTNYQDLIDEANHTNMTFEEFLESMLVREYELRKNN